MLLADLVSKTRTFPLIFIKFILFFQPPFTLLINFLLRSITIFGSWWVTIREYSAQTIFWKLDTQKVCYLITMSITNSLLLPRKMDSP